MLDRILKRLHKIFDKRPASVPVLSIVSATLPATITIKGLALSFSNSDTFISLDGSTLNQILAAINATSGYTATLANAAFGPCLARGLDEVVQDLSQSETFTYPTAILYNEMSVYAWECGDQVAQRESAELQLYANTAQDTWLDLWMSYFNIPRLNTESDPNFFRRAVAELFSIKVNNKALMQLISNAVGYYVDIVDLGENPQGWLFSNTIIGVANGTNPGSKLFSELTDNIILNGCFGVYLYNGSINNLAPTEKAAIVNIVRKYKASGKRAIYFAPEGLLIANDASTTLNNIGYVSAPATNAWSEVTI